MSDKENGFFWGIVVGVAAVVFAGAMALTRSFRTSRDGGRTWETPPQGRTKPKPGRAKKTAVKSKSRK